MEPQLLMAGGRALGYFQPTPEEQEEDPDCGSDRAKRFTQTRKSLALSRAGSEPTTARSKQFQRASYPSFSTRIPSLDYLNGNAYSRNLQQNDVMSQDDAHPHPRVAKRPASLSDTLGNSTPKRQQVTHNASTGIEILSGDLDGQLSDQIFLGLDASGREDGDEDVAQHLEDETRRKEQTETPEQAPDRYDIKTTQAVHPGTRSVGGGSWNLPNQDLPRSRQQSHSTENTPEQPHTLHQKALSSSSGETEPQPHTPSENAGTPQQLPSKVSRESLERGSQMAEHLRFPRRGEKQSQRNPSSQTLQHYQLPTDDVEGEWIEVHASERGRHPTREPKYTLSRTRQHSAEGSRTRSESRYRREDFAQRKGAIQGAKMAADMHNKAKLVTGNELFDLNWLLALEMFNFRFALSTSLKKRRKAKVWLPELCLELAKNQPAVNRPTVHNHPNTSKPLRESVGMIHWNTGLEDALRAYERLVTTIGPGDVSVGPRPRNQPPDVLNEPRYYDTQNAHQSSHTPKRGRESLVRTPTRQRDRSQSRQGSVRSSLRATSHISESQPVGFAGFGHVTLIKGSTPQSHTSRGGSRAGSVDGRFRHISRGVFTPTTSRPDTPNGGVNLCKVSPAQAETPLQEALRRKPQRPQETRQETIATANKATDSLFRKNIFGNISQNKTPSLLKIKPETPARLPSGRGLISDVIDLCTPESLKRPMPMKERLTPANVYKNPASTRVTRPKNPGAPNVSVKKAAKPKDQPRPQPVDSAAFRQQRAAETIVTKEIKGADEAFDIAIFGEVLHDQAAIDKKTEEARVAGQLEREKKMAALLAKEEAARLAEEENKKKQREEIAKLKLEKEKEEEKKRIKRIVERKKQEALELQEKEALRKKAAEKIRADRQKLAEEEKQKELSRQKAGRMEAQHLAQLEAKREAARKQAASLSASRLALAAPTKPDNSAADELDNDFQSLFVGADDSADSPAALEAQSIPIKQTDAAAAKAVPGNAAEVFVQPRILSVYRAEKEIEDAARAAERSKAKMNARYSANSKASKPDLVRPQLPHVAEMPPSRPRPVPAKAAAPKPPPKPKAQPGPKSAAGAKAGSNLNPEGSSPFGNTPSPVFALLPPALEFCDNPIAKRWFEGLPEGFSVFGKTKAKPNGPKIREYRHKVKLISEIEPEELEMAAKEKKATSRKKKSPTEEQKAENRRKRTEQARQKQIRNIQDLADRNGINLSESDLKTQVEEFMAQREKRNEKRNETRKLRESQAKEDDASDEGVVGTQQAAVIGTQQARPLDRSQPAAEVVYSDSETESEEDADDEPESKPRSSTATPEVAEADDVDAGSGSESDDTEVGAVPPAKSARNDTDHSISQMINKPARDDDRLVFIYQVIKFESEGTGDDDEAKTHTSQMQGQFVSLDEANGLVKFMVSKYREFNTRSTVEWFVGDKLHANIVFDARHEVKLYIKAYVKASSLLPAETLANLPARFPARSWIVMAYSERRTANGDGVLEVHHESRRIQQFTVLQMANHEACAQLIELTRPKRPKMDDVVDHNHAAEQMRGARDSANEEGVGFEVEIEGDAASWFEGTIKVAVEHFDVAGPLN
ncbi:hypothetical protein JHW43_001583 [Diplocarpon mali]|nr:hypothetical protein JHW43_001583 [Diplocarpon mali]